MLSDQNQSLCTNRGCVKRVSLLLGIKFGCALLRQISIQYKRAGREKLVSNKFMMRPAFIKDLIGILVLSVYKQHKYKYKQHKYNPPPPDL